MPTKAHHERPLSTEEIEAILEAEGATPPQAGQEARLDLVRREPGQGTLGKWLVCIAIAFIVVAAIRSYL